MLYVTSMVNYSWNQVSKLKIVWCSIKSKLLPEVMEPELNGEFGCVDGDASSL